MSKSIIGLDLGHHSVKAWEIQKKFGNSWELLKVYEEPLPDGLRLTNEEEANGSNEQAAAVSDFLRRFLENHGLLGKSVLAAMPSDKVFLHTLTFPQTNLKIIQQIFMAEVEDLLPFPIDDAIVDFQVLSKDENGSKVLVAAALRNEVAYTLGIYEEAGLALPNLGMEPSALANLEQLYAKEWADKRIALLDIGAKKSLLALFNQGKLEQVRVLRLGGRDIDLEAAELLQQKPEQAELYKETRGRICLPGEDHELDDLKLSEAIQRVLDDLAGECNRTLRKAENDWAAEADEILLTGGVAQCGGIEAYLAQRTGRNVRRLDLAQAIGQSSNGAAIPGSMSPVGLGVAMRSASASAVNFRKDEFGLRSAVEGVERRLVALAAIFLFSLIIWGGLGYTRVSMQTNRAKGLEKDIAAIYSDTVGDKVPWGKELALLKQSVEDLQAQRPAVDSMEFNSIEALRRISQAISKNFTVEIERYEFNFNRHEVKVRAETNTFEAVSGIEKALESKPEFDNRVEITKSESGIDGVKFSMVITY